MEIIRNPKIKCDADGCDFNVKIKFEQIHGYLNKDCPKCGANLLTQKDYEIVVMLHKVCNHPLFIFFARLASLFSKEQAYNQVKSEDGKIIDVKTGKIIIDNDLNQNK